MSHAPNQSATEEEGRHQAKGALIWNWAKKQPKKKLKDIVKAYQGAEIALNIINHFIKQKTK